MSADPAEAVICPACRAAVGAPCITSALRVAPKAHVARVVLAERTVAQDEVNQSEEARSLWRHLRDEHGHTTLGLTEEDVPHWSARHASKLHKEGRYLPVPHSHPAQRPQEEDDPLTEQEKTDADRAEAIITSLLAPKTPEEVAMRRVERDRDNAATLRLIVARLRARLSMDEKRVLISVAHRLDKGEQ